MADEATPFEIPESIADLDRDALLESRIRARAEIDRLNAIDDATITDEEVAALDAVLNHVDAIDGRVGEIDAEASERAERLAAARERAGSVTDVEEPAAEEEVAEEVAEVVEPVGEPEAVLASGTKRPVARAASKEAPTVVIKKDPEPKPLTTITASANVPGFDSGSELASMADVAQAFLGRVGSFGGSNPKDMKPGVYKMSPRATKFGVATIKRDDRAFAVDKEMSLERQMQIIQDAGKETSLSGNSVIAAGGWCAPSETIYSLFSYHTSAGLIDLPEVTARRGGIQFTKGPDFMTIFGDADAGFSLTEAQVEGGATKPCYALECPPFTEVRLDAVGFCATAPLLTEAAYPELVRQVLDMLMVGHQRRKSASSIARISSAIGTAINWGEIGGTAASGVADVLAGLELQAMRIRQSLAMDPNATIEGVAPYWLRAAFRNELSRRLSLTDPFRISDADVDGWLAERNIRLQFVYDYQMLATANTGTWTAFPPSVEIMLWPAGAFTRLVNDVINLTAVYDHDLLTQNEYTAAFVEEGMAIANTRGFGVKVAIDLRYNGSAGFPAIGAGEGITFAEAA